jgi:DNA-binding beta-propeller fold protein YncE
MPGFHHIVLRASSLSLLFVAFSLLPLHAGAQACGGNSDIGCKTENAACRPALKAGHPGEIGHCQTSGPVRGELSCECVPNHPANGCQTGGHAGTVVAGGGCQPPEKATPTPTPTPTRPTVNDPCLINPQLPRCSPPPPSPGLIVVESSGEQMALLSVAGTAVSQLGPTVMKTQEINDVAVSPDGSTAAVLSAQPMGVLFVSLAATTPDDFMPLTPVALIPRALAFTPDGNFIVVVTVDPGGSLVSIDAHTHQQIMRVPISGAEGVAATQNNQILVATRTPDSITLLNIDAAGNLAVTGSVLPQGAGPINVAASPNGQLALVSDSNGIDVLQQSGNTFIKTVFLPFPSPISIAFLSDGSAAFVLSSSGTLERFNIDTAGHVTGSTIQSATGNTKSSVHQLAALRASNKIAVHIPFKVFIVDGNTNVQGPALTLTGNDTNSGGIAAIPPQ